MPPTDIIGRFVIITAIKPEAIGVMAVHPLLNRFVGGWAWGLAIALGEWALWAAQGIDVSPVTSVILALLATVSACTSAVCGVLALRYKYLDNREARAVDRLRRELDALRARLRPPRAQPPSTAPAPTPDPE